MSDEGLVDLSLYQQAEVDALVAAATAPLEEKVAQLQRELAERRDIAGTM